MSGRGTRALALRWKRRCARLVEGGLGASFVAGLAFVFALGASAAFGRETQSLDSGWAFHLGDIPGAQAPDFNATAWSRVDVPHDWSISLPLDPEAPSGGNGGFFVNGIGWYRRTFTAPKTWAGHRVALEFDGVYMNCEVWLNRVDLGSHPYGYTPFRIDITERMKFGAENLVAVRVDNSAQPNSRWYSGSGIYRHVRLVVTAPVHIATGGVFVTTKTLSDAVATLEVAREIQNESDHPQPVTVATRVLSPDGREVATSRVHVDVPAGASAKVPAEIEIRQPLAWSPEVPALYRAITSVFVAAVDEVPSVGRRPATPVLLDEVTTPFGIRTVRVSAERGFELNGRTIKLNGGNVHHDNGVLGAAAFDQAEERRVRLLKASGFNAVRTAHNPPSPAFLDACDRLGLLVMDEAFDGWEKKKTAHDYSAFFKAWSSRDVAAMVTRDRNHPAVIVWSIGNEVFERGSPRGAEIARALAGKIRELDPTRPVTAGINGLGKTGDWTKLDPLFATLDVAGYNYELTRHLDDHARWPQRVMVSTESYQSEVFANWAIAHDTPFVVGDFVWSGMDYLGEAGIGRVFNPDDPVVKHWEGNMWPWHGAACGDIDLTGERRPISHYRAIVWDRGEKLYAAVVVPTPDGRPWHVSPWTVTPARAIWTWPGQEGRVLSVEVYSRHESARLYLNGKLIGEKPTTRAEEFRATFAVPFATGELKAVGVSGGREVETFVLKSAAEPARLRVILDQDRFRADGEDLAFVTIDVVDRNGIAQPNSNAPVQLTVKGPATLAGIGNADFTTRETYRDNPHRLFEGRLLAVLKSTHAAGRITVTVTSPGLAAATVELEATN